MPKVTVTNNLGRAIALDAHMTVADDGAGRAFLGRTSNRVVLQPGVNAGIDEEFFQAWKEQNKGFGMMEHITSEAEDEPESAERKE